MHQSFETPTPPTPGMVGTFIQCEWKPVKYLDTGGEILSEVPALGT